MGHHDQIIDRGTIELTAESELQILPYGGFLPQVGDEFEILNWQRGLQGEFQRVTVDPWFAEQQVGFSIRIEDAADAGRLILETVSLGIDCDFDGDGTLGIEDINLLYAAIRDGENDPSFDVTGDQLVNNSDLREFVKAPEKLNAYFGDANLDGEFNSTDLIAVFVAGEYEDAIEDNSNWSEGDWNADGDFNSSDFIVAFQDGGYELGPRSALQAVPEPSSTILVFLGLVGLVRLRKRPVT